MSSCCVTDATDPTPCPSCAVTGPVIGAEPVRPHRADAVDGNWHHCANTECAVIYYLDDDTVDDDEVVTQVGHKAISKPTPVCFCFAHTLETLAADLAANDGVSTAKLAVKAAVAEGFCACEHLNPSGKCCLPDIHRALKAIEAPALTGPSGAKPSPGAWVSS